MITFHTPNPVEWRVQTDQRRLMAVGLIYSTVFAVLYSIRYHQHYSATVKQSLSSMSKTSSEWFVYRRSRCVVFMPNSLFSVSFYNRCVSTVLLHSFRLFLFLCFVVAKFNPLLMFCLNLPFWLPVFKPHLSNTFLTEPWLKEMQVCSPRRLWNAVQIRAKGLSPRFPDTD